jgi:hypothetical protein
MAAMNSVARMENQSIRDLRAFKLSAQMAVYILVISCTSSFDGPQEKGLEVLFLDL